MRNDTHRLAGSIAAVLLLAACGGSKSSTPVTPQAVSSNTVAMTTPVVRQLTASLGTLGSNPRIQELLARLGLGSAGGSSTLLRSGAALRQDTLSVAPRRGAVASAATWVRQQLEQPAPADQTAQAFSDFLSTKVFTQANLESSDANSATFLLRGSVVCPGTAATAEEVAACAQQLDAMKLRIRAIPYGETAIDLQIMFGDARVRPVTIALSSTPSIAVTVDLAEAKSAVGVLSAALGTPVNDLPSVMAGVATVSLKVENQTKLTIESSISQAIEIAVGGAVPASVHVAAVPSLARLVADSTAQTVELSGSLGAVALAGPEEEVVCTTACTTVLHPVDVRLTSATGALLLRADGTARASFDLDGLLAKRDGQTMLAATLASPCVAELGDAGMNFTSPLDAAISARDDANQLVDWQLHAAGAMRSHELCDGLGSCEDWLELLPGGSFDLTGGATPLHATGPDLCVNLDAGTVGACPAFPAP